jgi:hypothetical protein
VDVGSGGVAGMETDAVDRHGRSKCCLLPHACFTQPAVLQ